MMNEFALLHSFSHEYLDELKKNGGKHAYSFLRDDGEGLKYHSLPLKTILRSLFFSPEDPGDGSSFFSRSVEERREMVRDARVVLVHYLGEEGEGPEKHFKKEDEYWKGAGKKLIETIAETSNKSPEKKAKYLKSIKTTLIGIDASKRAIYDLTIFDKSGLFPDFFCYDRLVSEAVAMGPLARYGFRFSSEQIEGIRKFYNKRFLVSYRSAGEEGEENAKEVALEGPAKARHLILCLYVYALGYRYGIPYVEDANKQMGILVKREGLKTKSKNGSAEFELEIREKGGDLVLEGIPVDRQRKFYAWRFNGYPYPEGEGFGKDPLKRSSKDNPEIIIDRDYSHLESEVPEYVEGKEYVFYPDSDSVDEVKNKIFPKPPKPVYKNK